MINRFFMIYVLLMSYVTAAFGGASFVHVYSPEDLIASGAYSDVVVATIIEVDSTKMSTNSNPPVIAIEITRVLSGNGKTGHQSARWNPYPHDVDWVGDGADERIEQWARLPLHPPKVGTRWILAGSLSESPGMFSVAPTARWDLSPDNLQLVIDQLNKMRSAEE